MVIDPGIVSHRLKKKKTKKKKKQKQKLLSP